MDKTRDSKKEIATRIKPLKNIIEKAATKSGWFDVPITKNPMKAEI